MHEESTILCGGLRTQGLLKQSWPSEPLVTIITAVYNGAIHLAETIESIRTQSYPNFEYIVVDGGSTDESVAILQNYSASIDYWISEKDHGISDAFNKGIRLARGDYLMFHGDGDGFVAPHALAELMQGIDPQRDLLISGRIQRIAPDGTVLFNSRPMRRFSKYSLLFRMSLPHQGLLTHRDFFSQYGDFDTQVVFAMDYELLLRAFARFPAVVCKGIVGTRWRADGLGNNRTLVILAEYDAIKRRNRVAPAWVLSSIHFWDLLKYHLKRWLRRHV